MAEQTIIAMSDSHGERDIVVDIKKRYQGKVDAIFHNGDSELESSDSVWEGIHVVRGNCHYSLQYYLNCLYFNLNQKTFYPR